MSKSSQEADQAVYQIVASLNGEFVSLEALQTSTGLTDADFTQALRQAINDKYIEGIGFHTSVGGGFAWSVDNPHVTYKGLKFIES